MAVLLTNTTDNNSWKHRSNDFKKKSELSLGYIRITRAIDKRAIDKKKYLAKSASYGRLSKVMPAFLRKIINKFEYVNWAVLRLVYAPLYVHFRFFMKFLFRIEILWAKLFIYIKAHRMIVGRFMLLFSFIFDNTDKLLIYRGKNLHRIQIFFLKRILLSKIIKCLALNDFKAADRYLKLMKLLYPYSVRAGQNNYTRIQIYAYFVMRRYKTIILTHLNQPDQYSKMECFYIGISYLFCMQLEKADEFLRSCIRGTKTNYLAYQYLGCLNVLLDDYPTAIRFFSKVYAYNPSLMMSHQNYAGRYDVLNYVPQSWEHLNPGFHMVYDNLCRIAEDLFLAGNYDASFRAYSKLLAWQANTRDKHPIDSDLLQKISTLPKFSRHKDKLLILSYEWIIQFGHIGLLDSFLKMAWLGMYEDANYILLAPKDKVANKDYLDCWRKHFIVIEDDEWVAELFPYQRYWGVNFMAWQNKNGEAEPWTKMAAIAQAKWADANKPPLIELTEEQILHGRDVLAKMGITEADWFVNLHVREAGYHKEGKAGNTNDHRNSDIQNYLDGVEAITQRGGKVVRLGDNSMQPLPEMHNVIDYANSDFKSSAMDLYLLYKGLFTIGTTSGLTTACISFGRPMLLLNCISNDWQLWPKSVNFAIKKLWNYRDKRYLSIRETTSMPVQGYLINSSVMYHHGIEAHECSSHEILSAVTYMLDIVEGEIQDSDIVNSEAAKGFENSIAHNPYAFGNARPVVPFYQENSILLG